MPVLHIAHFARVIGQMIKPPGAVARRWRHFLQFPITLIECGIGGNFNTDRIFGAVNLLRCAGQHRHQTAPAYRHRFVRGGTGRQSGQIQNRRHNVKNMRARAEKIPLRHAGAGNNHRHAMAAFSGVEFVTGKGHGTGRRPFHANGYHAVFFAQICQCAIIALPLQPNIHEEILIAQRRRFRPIIR
ncbi:MAG: Uncharacterised protein [Alphaproteobacteria bacterium]|nr:MAG: Uncharacterised protein [Alphaproteobacteria bacterium]